MQEEEKDNNMAAPVLETEKLVKNNNIFYNCTKCSSLIEILSISEKNNTIKFKCLKENNEKLVTIKEYLEEMRKYKINKIDEKCEKHNKKYIIYCFNCKNHLCKMCLKTKIHIKHEKTNIFEIQPGEEELNIIKRRIEEYKDKMNKLRNEKK